MTSNPFDDKAAKPDPTSLSDALGKAKRSWDAIVDDLGKRNSGLVQTWKFYGKKYGWQLKVATKRAALLYMIPRRGGFLAALTLNAKALGSLRTSDLPANLVREIESSRTYPEGRPARVEVTSEKQVDVVKRLLAIKLASQDG
jgi:hypothetical protein